MKIKNEDIKQILKMFANVDITDEQINKTKKETKPKTLEELIADPFKEHYTYLIDRTDREDSYLGVIVDNCLDWGERHKIITLDYVVEYMNDLRCEEPDEFDQEKYEATVKLLIEYRYGSMEIDW